LGEKADRRKELIPKPETAGAGADTVTFRSIFNATGLPKPNEI
jgi:hypothetical protein